MPAWIGVGGNLDGSREALVAAVKEISKVADIGPVSSLYQSAPRDLENQPEFLNSALAV